MKFGEAFVFIFKQKNWFARLIVPALCLLLPVVGWLVFAGWVCRLIVMVNSADAKPALPNIVFGADLLKGMQVAAITLLYALPMGLLVVAAALTGYWAINAETHAMTTNGAIGAACIGVALALYALLMILIIPVALANFAMQGRFAAAFKLGEILGLIKAAGGSWLLALVGLLMLAMIVPLGAVACGVGMLITAAYAGVVTGLLLGQAYQVALTPKTGEVVVEEGVVA